MGSFREIDTDWKCATMVLRPPLAVLEKICSTRVSKKDSKYLRKRGSPPEGMRLRRRTPFRFVEMPGFEPGSEDRTR